MRNIIASCFVSWLHFHTLDENHSNLYKQVEPRYLTFSFTFLLFNNVPCIKERSEHIEASMPTTFYFTDPRIMYGVMPKHERKCCIFVERYCIDSIWKTLSVYQFIYLIAFPNIEVMTRVANSSCSISRD